jgi:hypothetical protein
MTARSSAPALVLAILAIPIAVTCAVLPSSAFASSLRATGAPELVIYNDDFAMVRQGLALNLDRGLSDLSFEGIPPRVDSTSIRLTGEGFAVRRQGSHANLWNDDKVFRRFLGDSVVFRSGGRAYRGVLAGIDGDILFIQRRDSTDVLMMLRRSQVSEVEFPGKFALATRPSLWWRVESAKGGERSATLSYLISGLRWEAEYTAVLDALGKTVEWSGWATIVNKVGASFSGARISLVAGEVNRAGTSVARGQDLEQAPPGAGAKGPADFFAYHSYPAAEPIDLDPSGMAQVAIVPPTVVSAKRTYRYDGARDGSKVLVSMEFANDKKDGLGVPLPAGRVRVYSFDPAGAMTLAGEDRIAHTAAGERLRILSGVAFDLVGERTRLSHARVSRSVTEDQFRIRIRNRGSKDAVVTVVENIYGNWEISEKSSDYRKKDAETVEFDVNVGAGKEATLTYSARFTY